MAKKSMLAREAKRKKLVSRYAEKRKSILNELKKADTLEQIFELMKNYKNYLEIVRQQECVTVVGKQEDQEGFSAFSAYAEMQLENYLMTVCYQV